MHSKRSREEISTTPNKKRALNDKRSQLLMRMDRYVQGSKKHSDLFLRSYQQQMLAAFFAELIAKESIFGAMEVPQGVGKSALLAKLLSWVPVEKVVIIVSTEEQVARLEMQLNMYQPMYVLRFPMDYQIISIQVWQDIALLAQHYFDGDEPVFLYDLFGLKEEQKAFFNQQRNRLMIGLSSWGRPMVIPIYYSVSFSAAVEKAALFPIQILDFDFTEDKDLYDKRA